MAEKKLEIKRHSRLTVPDISKGIRAYFNMTILEVITLPEKISLEK